MRITNALSNFKNYIKRFILPKIPTHVSSKFRAISSEGVEEIKSSLMRHYFSRRIWVDFQVTVDAWLSSVEGKKDLNDHLYNRMNLFRQTVIPWLDNARPLFGAKILEIGCGTGASTVALAEQGAKVIGVDIDEGSIVVAKDRCRVYGLDSATFQKANASDLGQLFINQEFDFIIFFASLEHMTIDERIIAIKNAWDMLPKGGLLCVIETPNRLWYYDEHTSLLPFYLWLPDELAFKYSKFSPRQSFRKSYSNNTAENMLSFSRHGRGVSYHEFDLAIKKTEELEVVSSIESYYRQSSLYRVYEFKKMITFQDRYESYLAKIGPKIHRGFYDRSLNLIIRKD
jgi:S-adenosylmethionine-dependent methyltransferase